MSARSILQLKSRVGAGVVCIAAFALVAACSSSGSKSAGGASPQASADTTGAAPTASVTSPPLSSSAASNAASSAPASAASTEKVTLTWWDFFNYSPQADQVMTNLIAAFEKAHPNITIKRTPIDFADYATKLVQAEATHTFPDFAFINASEVPEVAATGAIADLTSEMQQWSGSTQFYPSVMKALTVDGKVYGAPYRTNTTGLFYNQTLMTAAGISAPPTTWDELRTDAKKLTKGSTSGFCFAGTASEESSFTLEPFLFGAGSDITKLGDSGSIQALTYLNDLINVDHSVPKSVLGWGQLDVANQMASGHCAMMINGPYGVTPLVTPSITFKWGVAPWPKGPVTAAAPLDGAAAVAGNGPHVAEAFQILEFMSDPKNITDQAIARSNYCRTGLMNFRTHAS